MTQEETRRWKARIVLIVFAAMMTAFIVLVSGCQTARGMAGDSAWLLQKAADNIQTEPRKE